MKLSMMSEFRILKKDDSGLYVPLNKCQAEAVSIGGFSFDINGRSVPFDWDAFTGADENGVFRFYTGKGFLFNDYELSANYDEMYKDMGLNRKDITAEFLASAHHIEEFFVDFQSFEPFEDEYTDVGIGHFHDNAKSDAEYKLELKSILFKDMETDKVYEVDSKVLEAFNKGIYRQTEKESSSLNENKIYKGIELEGLGKGVNLVHSIALYSMGHDNNVNADYLEKLMDIKRADVSPEQFDEINKLWSVVKMNYQICNGGIGQYFFNGYHKHWISDDKENEIFDKDTQVSMMRKMHEFAIEVYPEHSAENSKFARIIDFFDSLYLEENVPQMEMFYSDEDEQIWDEDLEDWVDNPAYEEPYEECVGHEDEIRSDAFYADNFDKDYYAINDYIEKVTEVYAQYLTKSIERDKNIEKTNVRASLSDKIQAAEEKKVIPEATQEAQEPTR